MTVHPLSKAPARGFGQMFGLDPRVALLTFVVDNMLFGGEVASLGTSIGISVVVGIAIGIIAFKAQMKWYGDDRDSAMIKAAIVALLTAIPTSIPALLYVPSGILGLAHNWRHRKALPQRTVP